MKTGTVHTDSVIRSQAGRILQDTLTDGATNYTSTYGYDGAGRLITAAIPHNNLTYTYGTSSCGANSNPGADGDRTGMTDSLNGAAASSTTYCYDNADRLTGTTVTGAGPTADVLSSTNLATGTNASITYDAHGNTTQLAGQTMTYDEDDRHMTTNMANGTSLAYERDATGAIVEMTVTDNTGATKTERYSSGGDLQWQLNPGGWVDGGTVTLTGGATISTAPDGAYAGSFANLQGATTVVTDTNGIRQGSVYLYDPFGQAIDPASGTIGTVSTDAEQPTNTRLSGISSGWAGSAGKMTADILPVQTIEMGDRQYVPGLGRFLSVDPVPGGNENDYTYAVDPINSSDYSGDFVTGFDGNPNAVPYNKTAAASNKTMRAIYSGIVSRHSTQSVVYHQVPAAPRSARIAQYQRQKSASRDKAAASREASEESKSSYAEFGVTLCEGVCLGLGLDTPNGAGNFAITSSIGFGAGFDVTAQDHTGEAENGVATDIGCAFLHFRAGLDSDLGWEAGFGSDNSESLSCVATRVGTWVF